jgi:hypothetical protein
MAANGTGGEREEEGESKKQKWYQIGGIGDLDESSRVYARMASLFSLAPHWRNSDIIANESECGCGAVDTSPPF